MKIGIDGRGALWYRGTGIGTYTYQLLSHLQLLDDTNQYHILYPEGSENHLVYQDNFNLLPIEENRLFQKLRDSSIEAYHVPQNGIGLPKEKLCPYIITLHDVIPYILPETCSKSYLKKFLEEMESIVKLTDKVITVSQYSKLDIHQVLGIPLEKIYVTPLAPEPIYGLLDRDSCKDFIRKKYGIERDYIFYIGGMSPRKNIETIIEAFDLCKNKLSKDYAVVIGGKLGRGYEPLRHRCETLGVTKDILFPGYISLEELPIFYNAASLFVYPSLYEGFGLPPLEAMACGIPTICSNVTSIPEVVGDSALLIHPHDTEQLAEYMIGVLEDQKLWELLSQNGLDHVKSFSWTKTAQKTIKVYIS